MRIGTFLPTYWQDYGTVGRRTAIEETAKAAKGLGYVSLWANDHIVAPSSHADMGAIIEPLITLASVIHLVPGMHLGTSTLVLPQRHAMLVAKQAAALAVLSDGHFILGVGAGWLAEEFAILGADFAQRGAVTDEAISAMRALWQGSPASFHGRFYDFTDAVCLPQPAQPIPLWVCGNSPAAIHRAARSGDAWDPFGLSLPDFHRGVTTLRHAAGERHPLVAAHLRLRLDGQEFPEAHIAGSPDDVAAALAAYQQAGLTYLICDFMAQGLDDLLRQMQLFAEHVAPVLANAP